MLNSTVLEVAIGLILVYLWISLICSAINEWIASVVALRSRTLKSAIQNLLNNKKDLADKIYKDPLIKALYRPRKYDKLRFWNGGPSHIPPHSFALTLLNVLAPQDPGKPANEFKDVRAAITADTNKAFLGEDMQKSVLALIDAGVDDLAKARENIEKWFDEAMKRVTGVYKRRSQWLTLGAALIITVLFNIDTLKIADDLAQDPTLRAGLAAFAESIVKEASEAESPAVPVGKEDESPAHEKQSKDALKGKVSELLDTMTDGLRERGYPFQSEDLSFKHLRPSNFPKPEQGPWPWLRKAVGLLLTIIAVSLGAPFWFGLLSKFVSLRGPTK